MSKSTVYIENEGQSDMIMRKNVLKTERERSEGAKTISVEEARRKFENVLIKFRVEGIIK